MRLIPSDLIVQEIFEPASKELLQRSVTDGETSGRVFFEYAAFCTTQLEDHYILADIKRMESLHRSKQEEVLRYSDPIRAAKMQNDQVTYKRLVKEHDRALKLQRMDKEELQRLHTSQRFFLKKALEQFLRCFTASTDFDQHIPKFCAIWLKQTRQPGINSVVSGLLETVPSYKFIPLLHQLCSRLSDEANDDFQSCLSQLLSRMLNDHPYHAFHQIYSTFTAGENTPTSRSKAARRIAERMSSDKANFISPRELSVRLSDFFSSYAELARIPVNKNTHQGNDIPLTHYPGLRKFRSKSLTDMRLPPPSLDFPISPTSEYASIPFVQKYHHSFKIAGGVNQPKILDSVLSTGKSFRELVRFAFLLG
jgi:serine-protein kinase ATM